MDVTTGGWRRGDEPGNAAPNIRVHEPVEHDIPARPAAERAACSNWPDGLLWPGLRTEQQQPHVWPGPGSTAPGGSVAILPSISSPRSPIHTSEQGRHSRPVSPGSYESPASSPTPAAAAPSRSLSSGTSTPVAQSIGSHPYGINDGHRFLEGAAAAARDSSRALRAEWDRYRTGSAHRERELERALPPFLSEHSQRDQQSSSQPQQYEHDQREREIEHSGYSSESAAGPEYAAGVHTAGSTATTTGGEFQPDCPVTLGEQQRSVRAGLERADQHQRVEFRSTASSPGIHQLQPVRGEHSGPRSSIRDDARGRMELVGTGTRGTHSSDGRELEHDSTWKRGDAERDAAVQRPLGGTNDYPNCTSREPVHALRSLDEPAANEPADGQYAIHAARSPPIATLESPSSGSVSPPASSAVLSAGARSFQLVSSVGRSPTTTPSPSDAIATASSAPAHGAPRLPAAAPDGPSQTHGQQHQQQRQHLGVTFGHTSGTPPYRTQRERDAGYSTQSSSVSQRASSPSATSPAIATASAVPV